LNQAGIPTFAFPDTAARAFYFMWRYSYNLKALYETPLLAHDGVLAENCRAADGVMQNARRSGRTILTEVESKQVLEAYGIPTVPARVARSEAEAVESAEHIGYPVVLKLFSETVTHKTDVGGVQLNLSDAAAVRDAYRSIQRAVSERAGDAAFLGVSVQRMVRAEGYELILGSTIDAQFGPVLLFGAGGQLVEVLRDRALALPPLNTTLARRFMEQTRIFAALAGVRGRKAVDLQALEELLVRFSQLVVEQPCIREIDINPLLASPEAILALDARIVLHAPETTADELPRLAIRPYPATYVSSWRIKNGQEVIIRPIRPEDEPLMIRFHQALSERSVYLRYFQSLKLSTRTAHERLTRICFIDYDREMALVAEHRDPHTGVPEVVAVARLSKLHGVSEAEAAAVIRDDFQHQGLGTELYRRLVAVARQEKVARVVSTMLAENREMRGICQKLGFRLRAELEDETVRAELTL
jgi:acetyltransferase